MLLLNQLRILVGWVWQCGKAWFELGHRVAALETELHRQAELHTENETAVRAEMTAANEAARSNSQRVHRRIDDLDRTQSDRLSTLDHAQQRRIDDWAQQLSGQINQLYLTLTRSPANNGK